MVTSTENNSSNVVEDPLQDKSMSLLGDAVVKIERLPDDVDFVSSLFPIRCKFQTKILMITDAH